MQRISTSCADDAKLLCSPGWSAKPMAGVRIPVSCEVAWTYEVLDSV